MIELVEKWGIKGECLESGGSYRWNLETRIKKGSGSMIQYNHENSLFLKFHKWLARGQ